MIVKYICRCDRCGEEYETERRGDMELNGIKYDLCALCEVKMIKLERKLAQNITFHKDSETVPIDSHTIVPEFESVKLEFPTDEETNK